jgi:hypothetical protein
MLVLVLENLLVISAHLISMVCYKQKQVLKTILLYVEYNTKPVSLNPFNSVNGNTAN